jgi:peptidoglycan/LPS O-acetylase OafA/YrhL
MPGLDVVRGLAITGVLFYHGFATGQVAPGALATWQGDFLNTFSYGAMGVHLFYVLSGFLIAGILIDTRNNTGYYKNFYLRRLLRIVPAYFLMIIVLKFTGAISWVYTAVCLVYLCNMPKILHASPEYGPFWSLSVEEQFYLTWPFIVRSLSPRSLFRVCIAVILISPVLRFGLQFLRPPFSDIRYKTWDVADFFAAGTLLAMSVRSQRFRPYLHGILIVLLVTGCVLVIAAAWTLPIGTGFWLKPTAALELSPYVLLFSGFVLFGFLHPGIALTRPGRLAAFLGDISYGLYLCHQFIFSTIDRWLPIRADRGVSVFRSLLFRFLFEAAVAIGVAFLSRRYFEAIFLRMKPRRNVSGGQVGQAA